MDKNLNIQFNENRSLGQLLNVTFAFTRQELKPLFKSLLILAGPLLILLGIITGVFMTENMELMSDIQTSGDVGSMNYVENFVIQYGLIILIYYLSVSVITAITLGYVVEYINNGPGAPFENVLAQVKAYLLKIFALNFVVGILVTVGLFIFLIPGIYLSVALILAPVALVIGDENIGGSLKRSMYLIRDNWWKTLGYAIIIGLLFYVISTVFSIPAGMLSVIQSLTSVFESTGSPAFLMLSIVLNILSVVGYLFYSIVIIFYAFYYHSLIEQKEAVTLLKSVEELAK